MTKILKSKYILKVKTEDGYFVIFNSLTKKLIKTQIVNKNLLLDSLAGCSKNNQLNQYLIENGFIVDDNEKETKEAENIYQEVCLSQKVLNVIILPTYNCNFRCSYCYESFPNVVMSESTQNDVFEYVKKLLIDYESLNISWFGGEPLLELETIIRLSERFRALCKREGKTYLGDITTNGYLLTVDTFKKLLKCNIRTYQITIDGLQSTHDKYRYLVNGSGTYSTIMKNLINIRDNIKSTMFQIVLRTNMTKQLSDTLNEHLASIDKEFLRDFRFKHVCRIAFAYNNEYVKNDLLNTESLINSSFNNLPQNLINESNRKYFISSFKDFICGKASVCYAGKTSSIVIDPLGKLMKCTVCLDDEKNVVGDIYSGIQNDKLKQWIERPVNSEVVRLCSDCPIYPICLNVSCPYEHFSAFDRKKSYCGSKIRDVLLYIQTLSHDEAMCDNIDCYFTYNNKET